MTVPTNTKVTASAVGNREDLSDLIVRIYADETPLQAMARRGKAKAVDHDWLEADIRAGVLTNAQPEGVDSEASAAKTRTRLRNKNQIFDENGSVSKTQEAVDKAGVRSELREQKTLKLREIALDKEATYCSAQEFAAEAGTGRGQGRKMSGIQCFAMVSGNTSRGTGGLDGSLDANGYALAPTAGTNRTFTEALFKTVIKGMYKNGAGGNKSAVMGAELKEAASAFTGIAEHRAPVTGKSTKATIYAAADIYVSDFGRITMMAHQSQLPNECLIVKDEIVEICTLRPTRENPIAQTGDAHKFQYAGEETLKVRNRKGLGIVADITAT